VCFAIAKSASAASCVRLMSATKERLPTVARMRYDDSGRSYGKAASTERLPLTPCSSAAGGSPS
jgi:hypothetical protein